MKRMKRELEFALFFLKLVSYWAELSFIYALRMLLEGFFWNIDWWDCGDCD